MSLTARNWRFSVSFGFLILTCFSVFHNRVEAQPGAEIQVAPSPPEFLQQPGFYTNGFTLQLFSSDPDVQIFYTTDGSKPNPTSALYSEGILIANRTSDPNIVSNIPTNNLSPGHQYHEDWQPPQGNVFKGNIIRAIAHRNGMSSEVISGTFFVDPDGANRYNLPVVSIITEKDQLFSDEIGIYVAGNNTNFSQRGIDWERPVHIEYFENSGDIGFSLDAGARIHGGTSRNRPLKSLRIYARGSYGTSWIEYPLFPDKPINRYKRFLLRNSGNDWSESMFRDAFMHTLIKNATTLEVMYSQPTIVFINGEYWGIQNMRDRFDQHYISTHFGVTEEQITILERDTQLDTGTSEGIPHYNQLLDLLTFGELLNNQRLAEIGTYMDFDNFIDYQISNIYFRNTDWPGNNISYWRYNRESYNPDAPPGLDGRWRWMVFDTDFGFSLNFDYVNNSGQFGGNNASHNTLEFALQPNGPSWPNPNWSTYIFRSLTRNLSFNQRFANRFADLLNSTFRSDFVIATIDSMAEMYRPHMPEHISRWNEPSNMSYWENEVSVMKTFADNRDSAVRDHLRNFLSNRGVSATIRPLTLRIAEPGTGNISVNSLFIDKNLDGVSEDVYPWQGFYYQNVPISLTAHPAPGYRFVRWEGTASNANSTEKTISVNLFTDGDYTAFFEFDGSLPVDEMNPAAWPLADAAFEFTSWDQNEPEGSYPESMVFLQSDRDDPRLEDEMTEAYNIPLFDYHSDDSESIGFPYRLTGRTRINGLGERGISFINTGRGRDLGAAIVALDTRDVQSATVSFTAGTERANSRTYNIRLQAKIGIDGNFFDLTDTFGNPIEYMRNHVEGHEQTFTNIALPDSLLGEPYVQLRWKYYYTGVRLSDESGQRDMLRLDNIVISGTLVSILPDENATELPGRPELLPNIPNPFNPTTAIRFRLNRADEVEIRVFNILGNEVAKLSEDRFSAGTHTIHFDASSLSSGVYLVKLQTSSGSDIRKITLIK